MKKSMHKSGFTLVELLIVIVVISILVTIMYPQFEGLRIRARLKEIYTTVEIIKAGEKYYYSKIGQYRYFNYLKNSGYAAAEATLNISFPKGSSTICQYVGAPSPSFPLPSVVILVYVRSSPSPDSPLYKWESGSDRTYKNTNHPYAIYVTADDETWHQN